MAQVVKLVGDLVEGEVRFQDGGDLLLSGLGAGRLSGEPHHHQDRCCRAFTELDHAVPRIRLLPAGMGKVWNTPARRAAWSWKARRPAVQDPRLTGGVKTGIRASA